MDKKYIARSLPITQPLADKLARIQAMLAQRLGFEPSLSEVVAYCAQQTLDTHTPPK